MPRAWPHVLISTHEHVTRLRCNRRATGIRHRPPRGTKLKTVNELAQDRLRLWEGVNSRTVGINNIEAKILSRTFKTDIDRLAGLTILAENSPLQWDDFKTALFKRMQPFA